MKHLILTPTHLTPKLFENMESYIEIAKILNIDKKYDYNTIDPNIVIKNYLTFLIMGHIYSENIILKNINDDTIKPNCVYIRLDAWNNIVIISKEVVFSHIYEVLSLLKTGDIVVKFNKKLLKLYLPKINKFIETIVQYNANDSRKENNLFPVDPDDFVYSGEFVSNCNFSFNYIDNLRVFLRTSLPSQTSNKLLEANKNITKLSFTNDLVSIINNLLSTIK